MRIATLFAFALAGCATDPHATLVIAAFVLLHIALTALAAGAARDAAGALEDGPTGAYVFTAIASLTPLFFMGGLWLADVDSGADGLGRVMPGLFVMSTLPISWLVLLGIAIRSWLAMRDER